MDSKLTLKLDQNVIDEAKKYAKKRNMSLSKMVENYFFSLTEKKKGKKKFTPLVKELSGIINLEAGYELKSEYEKYLIEKYK